LTLLQDDPSPPPDPRLAIAGYTTGKYVIKTVGPAAPKSKLRIAPYVAKPYMFDQRISCGPGPPTQVVVTGFDPLSSDSQIRAFFTAYGDVESVRNQVHPDNGSPLGICLVKFRDTAASRGVAPIKASSSAKRAEKEGTNQRIGLKVIKVQSDREGKRCDWLVKKAVEHSRSEEEKRRAKLAPTIAPPSVDLPANVPKGPSGKGISMRPPVPGAMPIQATSRTTRSSLLVEHEPIKPQMKRTPYIFIAHQHVPVLSTTVAHLKKRLKAFHWQAVRCDPTGYFVTFEESKRGEDEAVKCFTQCHTAALFTYSMVMECNQYGDPDYERSPSPERVVVEQKRKAEEMRVAEEEAEDLEWEKRQRAEALDPVVAAAEIVKLELLEKLASDIKSRIAGPALLDLMEPEKHLAKRRKLNISDPQSKEETAPTAFFARGLNSPAAGTPNSRSGFASRPPPRKALAAYDANRMRGKKPPRVVNAFADERRKAAPPRRRINNPMAQLLALEKDFAHETDDDEGRSSFTRDTEEQESRPMSRAPSTDSEDEESSRAHRAKRRRIEAGWGEDSDDEMMDDSHARSLLAHLIHKDPENMAEKELEQVLAILPRSSPIWKKAEKALKGFRRLRKIEQEADAIFGVETNVENKISPQVIITNDDEEARKPVETTELVEPVKASKKKASIVKAKKKTKKQLEEEAKAEQVGVAELPLKDEEVEVPEPVVEVPEPAPEETPEEEEEEEGEEERASVHYGVSTDTPQRTVEDDLSVVMDIDGWQHLLKDDEDLGFLNDALISTVPAKINDPLKWAWRQKQIKNLNRQGEEGVCRTETKIEGYYVLNSTGSARTEGVKKIRESEKSKYLPHRIRVQKEREARERLAKNEARTTTVVEGFKFTTGTKSTPTPQASNSRANRANNRRLVNDINISKNMAGAEADSMRFNQLKKRKKFVKFDRSAIHNWGLYAQESITANDMIIEYVGEKVRQRVADLREAKYDIQGVGSSYLFRIDEDTVVDATKMGGIARFINHSCTPNCTAKIIRVDGTKRIVIYALRDIGKGKTLVSLFPPAHANLFHRRGTHVRLQIRA
jgi:histone-lysine N-methyltransferase SETD1